MARSREFASEAGVLGVLAVAMGVAVAPIWSGRGSSVVVVLTSVFLASAWLAARVSLRDLADATRCLFSCEVNFEVGEGFIRSSLVVPVLDFLFEDSLHWLGRLLALCELAWGH